MDKKDQYDNPVGDNLNLSHEDQLPSIWDNISQELNDFDETIPPTNVNAIDEADLANVDNFSSIKEGFQKNFSGNQPPKFMWDKIEQDLESFITTDAPSDFSAIKAGFEQTYKENTAPNFIWNDLAEEMDNPSPKLKAKGEVEDYSFVKTGFEKKYSAVVVPLFSWEDLAERMDHEAALADTADRYSIIKESFSKEFVHHKPAVNTWSALNQQLTLDTYWGRIAQYWASSDLGKKAILFTAIGILIGGGRSCLFNESSIDVPTAQTIALTTNGSGAIEEKESIPTFKKSTVGSSIEQPENKKLETLLQKEKQSISSSKNNITTVPKKEGSVSGTQNKELINGEKKPSSVQKGQEEQDKAINVSPLDDPTSAKKDKSVIFSTAEKDGLLSDELAKNTTSTNKDNTHTILSDNLDLFTNSIALNWLGTNVMKVDLLGSGVGILTQKYLNDPAIAAMEEDNFSLVRQAQKGKKLRFEFGLISRTGTSLFLGENTSKAFSDKELASTEMCVTGAAGVMLNYHFGLNDAVVLGVYPYSFAKQCFMDYTNDGAYEDKSIELSFFDFSIGYQRTLVRYNSLRKLPSKLYTRIDLGLGYLMNSHTTINNEAIPDNGLYKKINFSVGLALGSSHEINQFIIDYGVTGNVGMNDLIEASNTTPILKPATLLNVGAYISVRYILFPRLEPSKKQRQFDWSPPFYIEEPAF
ncbi:hypothetical protein [Aureispira anguillae]|uniref:Uncharacterized protein n=1 Tax=Aureispira anguillae TaxID=2864201 RepID=A0A915YIS0_9BACT|nr:hypothetical protein [Aureispira anguillae]BDS13967.1 hypothetical protein AsAng_0047300 [Aureispira anguillae]